MDKGGGLSYDPTQRVSNEANDLITYMNRQHVIDEKVATNLRSKNPCRCPLFYGLPKVHKTDIPLRPIVSGCEGSTDHLFNFVTEYIQPIAELLPAYFKDSTDFLRFLRYQNATPEEYFLVTADVTSLYTNIPHQEGMEAIAHYLHLHSDFVYPPHLPTIPPVPYMIRIIKTILEGSTFEFGGTHYHHISGTSMGTRMAPPYANLFMGRIDEAITREFSEPMRNYKRFIDDIFFTFHGPRRELDRAMEFMNGLHNNIKFTFHVSTESIAFMDLTLSRNSTGGIGLLMREVRGNEKHNTRNKQKMNDNFLPIIMPYSRSGTKTSKMIEEYWKIIQNDAYLSTVFRERSKKAYKHAKSIKDTLISTIFQEDKSKQRINSQQEKMEKP